MSHYVDDIKTIQTSALLDSGTSTTFISKRVEDQMGLQACQFNEPIPLLHIDGTANTSGKILHYIYLDLVIPQAGHHSKTVFALTDMNDQDIILGIDWLQKHNPKIDWKEGTITLHCCRFQRDPLKVKRMRPPEEIRKYSFYNELKGMYGRKNPSY